MTESSETPFHEAESIRAESAAGSIDHSAEQNTNYEEGRITVSVRVRPLNSRETKLNAGSCIAALAAYNTLYILPPGESEQEVDALIAVNPHLRGTRHHRFTFDHVYPVNATQEQVYEQIGRPVLRSSFCGYHTCIFAYGQTGSGKTYCMMGPDGGTSMDDAPGIIPRLCREVFLEMEKRKIAAVASEEKVDFSVYVSYLEIYRERVRSLLNEVHDARMMAGSSEDHSSSSPQTLSASVRRLTLLQASDSADAALRVREHPTLGVFVEGLAEMSVTTEEQVLQLMARGNQRRHMASTRMNETSSRSHAIFTLQLLQKCTRVISSGEGGDGVAVIEATSMTAATTTRQLGAKINLVDLAGSERAKATGAEGETLKEGAQVNKSLTTLGIVINALAAQSTATASSSTRSSAMKSTAASKRHIPYRDSTLTFLLKESLGGNSKTFMIATVSPSADSYDESLSTLRYADRAKAIVMKAFVNETAGDKRIRELEEEVTRLREQIRLLLNAEAQRSSTVMATLAAAPAVLADSESSLQPSTVRGGDANAALDNSTNEDKMGSLESSRAHFQAADMESRSVFDGDAEVQVAHAGFKVHAEGAGGMPETVSPVVESPVESRTEFVAALVSELRRAEEMIRQISTSEAERNAYVTQLVKRREEQEVVRTAAAATTKDAATSAAGSVTATMRLCREDPYLLNMDGAGDWVVAHLGYGETLVGVFPPKRHDEAGTVASPSDATGKEGDGVDSQSASFDSSLVLPSHHADSDTDANEATSNEDTGARYVRLPREFSDGVGGPHCILERIKATDTAATTTSTTTLRGCAGCDTYVMRPMYQRLFVVKDGDTLLLQSGDVLDMGATHIQLKYMDPAEPPVAARGRRTVCTEKAAYGDSGDPSVDWAESDRGMGLAAASRGSADCTQKEALKSLQVFTNTSEGQSNEVGAHEELHVEDGAPGDGYELEGHNVRAALPVHKDSPQSACGDEDECASSAGKEKPNQEAFGGRQNSPTAGISTALAALQPPSRPFIPILALGKALPANRLSTASLQQHPSASGVLLDATRTDAEGASTSVALSDSADHSTVCPLVEEGIKALRLSAPFQSQPPPAAASVVRTRAPIKRDPQTVHLNPKSALPLLDLQSMRTHLLSNAYRSEPPPRFVGRYNLVLLGPSGSGKSSLVRNLQTQSASWLQSAFSTLMSSGLAYAGVNAGSNSSTSEEAHATIGIHTTTLTTTGTTPMSLHMHELGGTPCFSPLLDQLPSHRVVYLLCFPLHGGPSLMALRGFVEDILCRTDSYTVSLVLVGTHAHQSSAAGGKSGSSRSFFSRRLSTTQQTILQTQMEEVELQVVSLIQMLQPYPQLRPTVVGRFAVDNVHRQVYATGYRAVETFSDWLQWLVDLARDRCRADVDFAGGLVPARCMELGRQVGLLRECGRWCLSLRDFKALAMAVSTQYDAVEATDSSLARDTLRHHVHLLSDWGVLAHRFRSTPLREHVILDVLWLCRVLTTLACGVLVAEAEPNGLSREDSATMVAATVQGRRAPLTGREAALRPLLTPEAQRIIAAVKVATMETAQLLRYGVLSLPVLVTMLELHFKPCDGEEAVGSSGGDLGIGKGALRRADNIAVAGRDPSLTDTCYSVPLAGVLELLVLCDLIILGHKLLFSPSGTTVRAATPPPQDFVRGSRSLPVSAASQQQGGAVHGNDDCNQDDIDLKSESFVVYPLSCHTPASAGVTGLFPCFLSGPFYMFTLGMVPRNFFPKLICRLATVSAKIYLGPVQSEIWDRPMQRWKTDVGRGRSVIRGQLSVAHGPFDSYVAECAHKSFALPRFSTYFIQTSAEGSLRLRDGLWFNAAWLVYKDEEQSDDCEDDNCRVLVRLVHHSVFLSFHCHQAASSWGTSSSGASRGVQDFYEAVLESVRHVVEEFPGCKCSELIQSCEDPATLLEMELKHPAAQSDQEAAGLDRHMHFTSISDNLNSLERVLARSDRALRTARTARHSQTSSSKAGEDESAYVPLLRNFSTTCPLEITECIRRWKTEQRFYISAEVESQLVCVLQELGACYQRRASSTVNSCSVLDRLLDVLARIDTA
ncbi:Kinesin motor domain containing protein [Leishmania braziliensis]|nr:Kinesin motor domain containing protein [Leishmania braziliensis]